VVFGLTTTLQRRAVAKGRRHSRMCRAEGFLGEILPPVPASLPQRYVPFNLSLSRPHDTVLPSTYISACFARLNTTVGNLPHSSYTRTGIAEDLLSQGHRVRTRRTPAIDHVRSVKVLFFLTLGREVLFERNRPSSLDTITRGPGHSTHL
jgi:hypothetical protein